MSFRRLAVVGLRWPSLLLLPLLLLVLVVPAVLVLVEVVTVNPVLTWRGCV